MTTELTLVKTYLSARSRIFSAGIKKQREITAMERREQKAVEERKKAEDAWREDLRRWAEEQRVKKEKKDRWKTELREWGLEQQRKQIEAEWQRSAAKAAVKKQACCPVDEADILVPDEPNVKYRRVGEIVNEVLEKYNGKFTIYDIVGRSHRKSVVEARHECIWRVYQERKDLPLNQIAKKFFRDHSTALNAIRKHEKRLSKMQEAAE